MAETRLANKTFPDYSYLTSADLPALMVVPDARGSYRYPILQFVVDWNRSSHQSMLIEEPPIYEGNDPVLLPAVAVLVHALAERADLPVPDWVYAHRAADDALLFGGDPDGGYGRWVRPRAPSVCAYHRVWFHRRVLTKGTSEWWLPWD